jgi:lipoprotein-anchoring transpeptidase ErfK/SrfK
VLRTTAAFVLAAGLACAATPAATPTRVIPAGVTVAGISIGGLSAEPARDLLRRAAARPVVVTYRGRSTKIPRSEIAGIEVDDIVETAFTAQPHRPTGTSMAWSDETVDGLVSDLAKRYNRSAVAAHVVGATGSGPQFAAGRAGVAVDRKRMHAALLQAVSDGAETISLLTEAVPAKRTAANFGPVVVITRGVNTLKLYDGRKLVRTFHVATGQPAYPTPGGVWRIVDMQRNPWWHPPTSAWARGLQPIPPGPSNPLGTRWMGLDASGVGIHGTNAPASIGYSLSHGCIRMQVPEAEWLFEHVQPGTPVVIL